jgi:chaperone modulatory protein CbpM
MQETVVLLSDDTGLTLEELALGCTVSREWVIEHVRAGVLPGESEPDPGRWMFSGRDLVRARRMFDIERNFDANPELAGLVADLIDELNVLKARLRRGLA